MRCKQRSEWGSKVWISTQESFQVLNNNKAKTIRDERNVVEI